MEELILQEESDHDRFFIWYSFGCLVSAHHVRHCPLLVHPALTPPAGVPGPLEIPVENGSSEHYPEGVIQVWLEFCH